MSASEVHVLIRMKWYYLMRLPRIDITLEICENHLTETESFGTQIEILLTYSLLVIIYAEFEQRINYIVQEKFDVIENECLRGSIGNVSRILSGALGDLLERFGPELKPNFRSIISASQANQRAETFYNNLITNRNDTAHAGGSNLTFRDVKLFYEEGHVVLDFFRDSLLSTEDC